MITSSFQFTHAAAQHMAAVPDGSVDLIVTSPPYPMVEMWDDCFSRQSGAVAAAMEAGDWDGAFEQMHRVLDGVWDECCRVLRQGGFACINIGDATRSCGGTFRLFSNHARILRALEERGLFCLPDIHWRKPSNAPSKFMGSGMYPAGAYVTYEHEYILIFRKGGKRVFRTRDEVERRRESAYFWEERNTWFSDLWEINGAPQALKNCPSRARSAAFPLEVPYRLVNMYSAYGDTVLDPFGGLGTTALACAGAMRSCRIYDADAALLRCARDLFAHSLPLFQALPRQRLERHQAFLSALDPQARERCYQNLPHGFLVKTQQERQLRLYRPQSIAPLGAEGFTLSYAPWE